MIHLRTIMILAVLLLPSWLTPARAHNPVLINGTIVTPERVIPNGWVAIEHGKILSITETKPAIDAAHTLVTKDIVFPGFVDLHNHPIYGIFPRWKAPQQFASRYQWRGHQAYLSSIQTPEGKLVTTHFCDMDAYVELQALAGGTTSILGLYQPADTATVPDCVKGLARNLDWASGFHGDSVGHEPIANVLGVRPTDWNILSPQAVEMAKTGNYDLLAVHLGEGRRDDADSRAEFATLKSMNLLNAKTVVIHGVALNEADFGEMQKAETSFIWSPRSNFELYGQTADVPAAIRQHVTMALAPDWSPTGSMNMLAEIGYAKTVSDRDFGGALSAHQLFDMATSVPAKIAKIDDKVGSLRAGLYADLFLLRGDASDVYATLAKASPQDVTLTMVNGVAIYGANAHLKALGITDAAPTTICGTQRAVNPQAVPAGTPAQISGRLSAALKQEGLKLASLAECPAKSKAP